MKTLISTNYYPSDLDIGKALTTARKEHCVVRIDCKCWRMDVDESMTLAECREQVEKVIW